MKIKQEQRRKKPFINFPIEFSNYTYAFKKNQFKIKQFLKMLYMYNKKKKKIFLLNLSETNLFNILKPLKNVTIRTSLPKNAKTVSDGISNQELFIFYTDFLTKSEVNTIDSIEKKLEMFKIPCFVIIGNGNKQRKSLIAEHHEKENRVRLSSGSLLTVFN